jgi:hypothetical protein
MGYGEGKKRYRCFDSITQKLYMSRHVVFQEHIPFFFIPSTTRPDIICIDPFSEDSDIYHLRFLVPQIPLPMFDQFVLIILQILTIYSLAHLKLYSHLQPLKLLLRL